MSASKEDCRIHDAIVKAAHEGRYAVLCKYFQEGKIDTLGFEGRTPLTTVLDDHLEDAACLLIRAGADHWKIKGNGSVGTTMPKLLQALVDAGLDMDVLRYHGGDTLLHRVVSGGCASAVDVVLDQVSDVNAKNDEGLTPLHIAAQLVDPEMITMLLRSGADPLVVNHRGNTPMDMIRPNFEKAEKCYRILRAAINRIAKSALAHGDIL